MTDGVRQAKGGDLGTKVKALLWEECRTGGAIAGVCLSVGVIVLLSFRSWDSELMHARDPFEVLLIVLGVPMATSLLLILNPDYSGHLAGGFSNRVLRLPVPTSIAVGVALAARTLFVFLVAFLMIAVAHLVTTDAPDYVTASIITGIYLVAQLLDWLCKPISGLSSLIVLCLVAGGILFVSLGGVVARDMREALGAVRVSPLLLLVFAAVTYGVSVVSVQAARVGKRVGVPEIWEWRDRFSLNLPGRSKPFSSPIGAQVWFETRRTVWALPQTTFLIWLVLMSMAWIIKASTGDSVGISELRMVSAFLLFAALLLAAVVQGARTRILGFRRSVGKPGYEHLLPLTDHQLALSRVFANAVVLVPVLGLVVFFHFFLGGPSYVTQTIPDALEAGVTSWREVIWTLVSRGLVVGIAAWGLLAIGTRTFRRSIGLLFIAGFLLLGLFEITSEILRGFYTELDDTYGRPALTYHGPDVMRYKSGVASTGVMLYLIGLTIVAYIQAWKQGLTPGRTVAIWAGIWAAFTWLMHYAVAMSWPAEGAPFLAHVGGVVSAMGCAALVPLVYVAVLMDVRRRRHSATPPQHPAQHAPAVGVAEWVRARPLVALGTGCAVLFSAWLGWPGRPAYESLWKELGYPVTLTEFDAWYPYVPDEENVALKYMELQRTHAELLKVVYVDQSRKPRANRETSAYEDFVENLLVVGSTELSRAEPIPEAVWNTTEEYWNGLTAEVAGTLKELAETEPHESRYPIDLKRGFNVDLPNLAHVRGMARELQVDALHWVITGDTGEAVNSVLAILPLAKSFENEPLLISQWVRIAILGIAQNALETVVNRSELSEADLMRLQQAWATVLPAPDEQMILDRAIIGEGTNALNVFSTVGYGIGGFEGMTSWDGPWQVQTMLQRMLYSPGAERMAMATFYAKAPQMGRQPWVPAVDGGNRWGTNLSGEEGQFMTPLTLMLTPSIARSFEAEWRVRTQLDVGRTALAVERYRLANGGLPESLEALVPVFLDGVPDDYFSATGESLRYRQRDDGEFVVYSVGHNMEDDRGVEMDKWHQVGDITFTVAPLGVRLGPQIAVGQ